MISDPALQTLHEAAKLALKENRFREAIQYLDRAIANHPDDVIGHTLTGIANQRLGQNDAALRAFSRAAGLNPTDAVAHFNLGQMYHLMEDTEAALESIDRCLSIDPGHLAAVELRDRLAAPRP